MPDHSQVVSRRFVGGPLLTDCYAIIVPGFGTAIIDAPRDAWTAAFEAGEAADAPVQFAIATHGHWDHVTDLARIQELGVPVMGHANDQYMLSDPHGQGLMLPFVVDPVALDRNLVDGDVLKLGDVKLHVLHTPGHTPGSLTIWVPALRALFTGDTLLKGGAGHTAEPGASLDALAVSVRRLAQFDDDVTLYPGHGAPTTIGDETWLKTLSDPAAPLVQWRASNLRREKKD